MTAVPAPSSVASVEQLQALVEMQRQELDQLRQAHQELMRVISHDLRAPLRHVISFSPLLQESVHVLAAGAQTLEAQEAAEDAKEFAQTMVQAAKKMARMLEGVGKLSKLARHEVQWTSVQVYDWLQDWLRAQSLDKKVRIDCPNELQMQARMVDPEMLRAVLTETLSNAMFATRDIATPEVVLRIAANEQQALVLEVVDNGLGCRPELQGSLGKAFTKFHSEKYFPGPGVGLAMVQVAAQKMGARTMLATQPGQGFSIKVIFENKNI